MLYVDLFNSITRDFHQQSEFHLKLLIVFKSFTFMCFKKMYNFGALY